MALTGHTDELSLPDLIQLKGMSGGTSRVLVEGPAGDGVLVIDSGFLVHAEYASLTGEAAAYSMLSEQDSYYLVQSDIEIEERSMRIGCQGALMEAMRRKDEGLLPKLPRAPASARKLDVRSASSEVPMVVPKGSNKLVLAVIALFLVVGVAGGVYAFRMINQPDSEVTPPGTLMERPQPVLTREPVESSNLVDSEDKQPVLITGKLPASPDPDAPMQPTVVVRLLIDMRGVVAEATVFRSRPEFEIFEQAALEAVKKYRFEPGRDDGQEVPVWINWPVDFI